MASERRRHRRGIRSGLVLLLLLAVGRGAAAEPTPADRATARSLMQQGDARLAARNPAGALQAYQAAHAIMAVPTTGLALARAQTALGLLVEARETALGVMRHPAVRGEPVPFTRARAEAVRLADQLAERIPAIVIVATGSAAPGELRVAVDEAEVPPAALALPRKVNPGRHAIRVSAPDCEPAIAEVRVAERETRTVTLALVRRPPRVTAAPSRRRPLALYLGLGAGAAALIAGTTTGILSLSYASSARSQCSGTNCPAAAQGDIDAAQSLATASNVSFIAAAVAIGAVGLWWLLAERPERRGREARVRLVPTLGPGAAGVAGRF